ncbi:aldehyde dehydrogenase family protein, partial [Enterobacter hormaechei]|uniref:aldehyde dehydrogenase family protein n=1 Tax=Enterobacter hormaechei TaxID=158836 RepID=UPI0019547910
ISTVTLDVFDPATEEAFTKIALGTVEDADKAIAAAKKAFGSFSRASRKERIELLEQVVAVYKKRAGDMAEAISREM